MVASLLLCVIVVLISSPIYPTPVTAEHQCLDSGYTIILSSFNRIDALNVSLRHWRRCPHVKEIQIVWHNPR